MAWFYDAIERSTTVQGRDKVWLNGQNITTTQLMRNLTINGSVHTQLKKAILKSAYWLKLPSSFGQTHPVFSVMLLRPYNADSISKHIECDPPPHIDHNEVEEYEVEQILDSQVFRGKLEYLVQ